jgi:hypothetical protein
MQASTEPQIECIRKEISTDLLSSELDIANNQVWISKS